MAAEFLATLRTASRTVVSVLRSDQYDGLESFTDVGSFVPLVVSKSGNVVREVAPASIALPLPDHPGESLLLRVALIRDLRRHVPVLPSKEDQDTPSDGMLTWTGVSVCGGKRAGRPPLHQQPRPLQNSFPSSRPHPRWMRSNSSRPTRSVGRRKKTSSAISCSRWAWIPIMATGKCLSRIPRSPRNGPLWKNDWPMCSVGGCCAQAFSQRE